MVLLKELLDKFDINITSTKLDDALLNTGYDEELSSDDFTYTPTIVDDRNKHTFTDDKVTLTLWENPIYLIIEVIHENGMSDSQEFDEKGNVVASS